MIHLSTTASDTDRNLEWRQLPPLPDRIGFAGAFAGICRNALLVGGGANFPDKMPWEGGTKVWHDQVFVLEQPEGSWKSGFRLPHACAYGVSVTVPDGVVCIGGSDSTRHLQHVFLLQWDGVRIRRRELPSLPIPLANFCGVCVEQTIYIAGGTRAPDATAAMNRFFRLDPKSGSGWQELEPWPGPARMLAMAAVVRNSFLLFGGTELLRAPDGSARRRYLKDAYSYRPEQGWKTLADMPNPVAAAASPAPVIEGSHVLIVGGDDGALANFEPKSGHPGFPKRILSYNAQTDRWSQAGQTPAPRATLPTAFWESSWVFPSGEARPGVRSPEVWVLQTR